MKLISSITVSLVTASTLFLVGCNDTAKPKSQGMVKTVTEESLGLRKTDLYSEKDDTVGEKTQYSKSYAGSGKLINRAFQDAPPMIPHDVEGMYPIQINNNQCVSCHLPEVAASMNATPVPESHLTDFRPTTTLSSSGKIVKNGKVITNTSSPELEHVTIKKMNTLSGTRFNCSLCHAPQSEGQLVENTFSPDFTSKDGAKKSAWKGSKLTEGLDTLLD